MAFESVHTHNFVVNSLENCNDLKEIPEVLEEIAAVLREKLLFSAKNLEISGSFADAQNFLETFVEKSAENQRLLELSQDFLRFWVLNQEISQGIAAYSVEIVESLSSDFLKIVDSLAKMLAFFEKNAHLLEFPASFTFEKLQFNSRFILQNLYVFVQKLEETLENAEFSQVFHILTDFFIDKLQEVYLNSLDLCEKPREIEQFYVFSKVLHMSSAVLAPIFPNFAQTLAEKLRSCEKKPLKPLILGFWPQIPAGFFEKNQRFLEKTELFVRFRGKVRTEIEKIAGFQEEIAKIQRIQLIFVVDDVLGEEIEVLESFSKDLAGFLNVSEVLLQSRLENKRFAKECKGSFEFRLEYEGKRLCFVGKVYEISKEIGEKRKEIG